MTALIVIGSIIGYLVIAYGAGLAFANQEYRTNVRLGYDPNDRVQLAFWIGGLFWPVTWIKALIWMMADSNFPLGRISAKREHEMARDKIAMFKRMAADLEAKEPEASKQLLEMAKDLEADPFQKDKYEWLLPES